MRATTTTKRTEPTQAEKMAFWNEMHRVGAPTMRAIVAVHAAAAEAVRVLGAMGARRVLRAAAGR